MSDLIQHGEGQRFQLVTQGGYQEVIIDNHNHTNLFFLAGGGFGVPSSTSELAERIVDYLNKHHTEDKLYPRA